ncbi:MAG: chromate transporter, partial [Planctomycetota bacterium]
MSALRLLLVFAWLGCRGFGGPIAHISMFRTEFVQRRAWLSERDFADLLALCQFLPGPTSSQMTMLLGWRQGGLIGLGLSWLGFLLPSAVLMIAAGLLLTSTGVQNASAWIAGMKIAVLAIVANALVSMAKQWCPDLRRRAIAIAAALAVVAAPAAWWQLPILATCGLAGYFIRSPVEATSTTPSRLPSSTLAVCCVGVLVAGLVCLPMIAAWDPASGWQT